MDLIGKETGDKLNGIIELLDEDKIASLSNSKNFTFDWGIEKNNQVYTISIINDNEILGLMSIIDVPHEFRIHINLIEAAKGQRGKHITILNIPGCLIAFACRTAFKKGYDGFVSLTPKTRLRNYYSKTYGFMGMGTQMAVFGQDSFLIIQKYLQDEEI